MTGKITIKLIDGERRTRAAQAIHRVPDEWVVTIAPPTRTLDQNALLWAALNDIASAKPDGREMTAEQWKCAFMDAAGFRPEFVPALEGSGFICLGYKSSRLSKTEFSELVECVFEFGARKGVQWSLPEERRAA